MAHAWGLPIDRYWPKLGARAKLSFCGPGLHEILQLLEAKGRLGIRDPKNLQRKMRKKEAQVVEASDPLYNTPTHKNGNHKDAHMEQSLDAPRGKQKV